MRLNMCTGEGSSIEEQLLKNIIIEEKNILKKAFLAVLRDIILDYQIYLADDLIDNIGDFINRENYKLQDVMETVKIFSYIRKSFDYEEEIYNHFEEDVFELLTVYLTLISKNY